MITISTTPQIRSYLEALVTLGVYGKNPAEAAEQLIKESLRDDLREKRRELISRMKTPAHRPP
jgi:hypothetical protein